MLLLCVLAFSACGQKNGEHFIDADATHITRVMYKDGVCTLKERLLKTDTGYVNDGIKELLFEDGNKQVEFYKLGRPDSVILVFYPSGALQDKINVYQGGIVGPVHRYFPNGQLEAFVWFIDPTMPGKNNEGKWTMVFDSTGVIVKKTGRPIVTTLMGDRVAKTRDSVTLSFFFAPSPDSMHTLFLISSQLLGKKAVDTFTSFNEFPPMRMMELTKRYPFHKDAKYSGIYLLLDKKNRIVVSDTAEVDDK